MSVSTEHRISNAHLITSDTNAESQSGQRRCLSTVSLPASALLSELAVDIAEVSLSMNGLALELKPGVPAFNDFLWAGDSI
jgi:hypothetical protein